MGETTIQFHPETKKPMPVSAREYQLMDRHEKRVFEKVLSDGEKKDFQLATMKHLWNQPLSERRDIANEFVAKLEKRENKSIGDKVELVMAKVHAASLKLPEKHPIFFRKFRQGEHPIPKILREAKSPYMIG